MSQKELAEISAALASEYPDSDKVKTAQEFQSVLETVLPALASRALPAIGQGVTNIGEAWQFIRADSEGLFGEALEKVDRVKVIFVASKFMNNKLIGETVTRQALEIAKRQKEN